MTDLRIPPRQDFNVSEQVYEWLRGLSTEIQKKDNESTEDQINTLLGFFQSLESKFNDVQNLTDTNELLNAKIRQLEESISLLPEESELSLYKAFLAANEVKSGVLKPVEYRGTFQVPAGASGGFAPIACPAGKRIRLMFLYVPNSTSEDLSIDIGGVTYLDDFPVRRFSDQAGAVFMLGNQYGEIPPLVGGIGEDFLIYKKTGVTSQIVTYGYDIVEDS